MRRLLAAVLVVALLASGCATFTHAVTATPRRTAEASDDPVRRVHLATQAARIMGTASVGIGCVLYLAPTIVGVLACPFIALGYDFLMFEYVLEPLSVERVKRGEPSLLGPWWETGPRVEEGEFFSGCEKPTPSCRPRPPAAP